MKYGTDIRICLYIRGTISKGSIMSILPVSHKKMQFKQGNIPSSAPKNHTSTSAACSTQPSICTRVPLTEEELAAQIAAAQTPPGSPERKAKRRV